MWHLILSFIPSEIKFASFPGLAQFEHPHHFLSQQTPLAVWSDETRMLDMLRWLVLGMSMIPKPQWGCDKMCYHRRRSHFPQTQPSGLLRLLACITVPPNVRKVPSWQHFMCEDDKRVNSLSSNAKQGLQHKSTTSPKVEKGRRNIMRYNKRE